jgi:hypothetical protein
MPKNQHGQYKYKPDGSSVPYNTPE